MQNVFFKNIKQLTELNYTSRKLPTRWTGNRILHIYETWKRIHLSWIEWWENTAVVFSEEQEKNIETSAQLSNGAPD